MEVSGRQPGKPIEAYERFREAQVEFTQAQRDKVRRARTLIADAARRQIRDRLDEERQVHARRSEAAREERAAEIEAGRSEDKARSERTAESRETRGGDRIELSHAAKAVQADDGERARRVEALRQEHREGGVATTERMQRAAQSLLSQDG